MLDSDEKRVESGAESVPKVGYKNPPMHTRFKPGQSGNPSGRAKGSQNLRTIFGKILKEQVTLREGSRVRKISKAEAIMRGLVVGAMKGDQRSAAALFQIAEQTGEFQDPNATTGNQHITISWQSNDGSEPD